MDLSGDDYFEIIRKQRMSGELTVLSNGTVNPYLEKSTGPGRNSVMLEHTLSKVSGSHVDIISSAATTLDFDRERLNKNPGNPVLEMKEIWQTEAGLEKNSKINLRILSAG